MSSNTPDPRQLPIPEIVRTRFDEAYGELYSLSEDRSELEILAPMPNDVVRLFFELADEAIQNPSRDNPFATEKRVFELSSETLAAELARLQKLGEEALSSFARSGATASAGQLPGMLAGMYVGRTVVRPAPVAARFTAWIIDAVPILSFSAVVSLFVAWFTAPELRAGIVNLDLPTFLSLAGLTAALFFPVGILYNLRARCSAGYAREKLEVVSAKSGNLASLKTNRLRGWLFPLSLPSALLMPASPRSLADRVTGTLVRRNLARASKASR